jgi:hypothetical protein
VVLTVTRRPDPAADDNHVNGPVRLVLTVELAVIAEPIAGLVRSAEGSSQAFSGWSELFAALQTLIRGDDRPAIQQEQPPC